MWSYFIALKRNWAQHFISQSSGFLILFITYSAAILVASGMYNLQKIFDRWGEVSQLTVYLEKTAAENDGAEKIKEQLKTNPFVREIKKVHAHEAAERFSKRLSAFGSSAIQAQELKAFFPDYLEVSLAKSQVGSKGIHAIEDFAASLKRQFQGISEVKYGKAWLDRYMIIFNAAYALGWALIGLFLIAAAVVSSSVIKTVLFHRREEIEVLDFIGADERQIYLPQIMSTLTLSLGSFLLALLGNIFLVTIVNSRLLTSIWSQSSMVMAPLSVLCLIAFICFVSILASSIFTIYKMLPSSSIGSSES